MSEGRTMTQGRLIMMHLLQYGTITPMEAYERYGCLRLAARISDLKDGGNDIWTERVPILNEFGKEVGHYGKYHLRGIAKENG